MSRKKNHNREWPLTNSTHIRMEPGMSCNAEHCGRMPDLELLLSSNVLLLNNKWIGYRLVPDFTQTIMKCHVVIAIYSLALLRAKTI